MLSAMKTILVPIDYSDESQNILAYALELARTISADVIVFHAFFPIMSPPASYNAADVVLALEGGKRRELEQFTHKVKEVVAHTYCLHTSLVTDTATDRRISDFDGVHISCIAKMGGPYEAIKEAIRKYNADLVVMGMQEGEALSQALLGSTTISMMQDSPIPILALPKGATFKGLRSVLFAADLHKLPVGADLRLLREFVKAMQAKLQVLHLYRTQRQFEEFEAQDALDTLSRNFEGVDYDVSFDLCEHVAAGIQRYVREQQVDLLVLIPQKHTLFERLLDKSVTGKITAHPLVPLLSLPPAVLHHAANTKEKAFSGE